MMHVPINDAFGGNTVEQDLHGTVTSNSSSSGRPKHVSSKRRQQHHQGGGGGGTSTTGKPSGTGMFLEVYDPDFLSIVTLPAEKVIHTPNASLGVSRLVFCRNFLTDTPGQCVKGSSCKFVHADATGCKRHHIHVNYAWRSLDAVMYQRLPAGETLSVSAPNDRPPVEELPSERILVTRGSLMRNEHAGPLSHCAHYYFNRMCNRGERCSFIHAVVIDPAAQDLQRAPAPTSIAPLSKQSQHGKRTPNMQSSPSSSLVTGMQSVEASSSSLPHSLLMGLGTQDTPSNASLPVTGSVPVPGMQPAPIFYAQTPPIMTHSQQPQSLAGPGMIFFPHMVPPGAVYYLPNSPGVQPSTTSIPTNAAIPLSATTAPPSMTSLFVLPPGTGAPPMFPVNPLDWSFHGSIHNNASMSHSTSGVTPMGSVEMHYQPM